MSDRFTIRLAGVSLLLLVVAMLGCGRPDDQKTSTMPSGEDKAAGPVTMTFDMGDEAQTVTIEDVLPGTTLETLMRGIEEPTIELTGTGTTAFVSRIGDWDTSGREGWTFQVDGKFSPTGVGTTEMSPPATVTWKYGDFSPPTDDSDAN